MIDKSVLFLPPPPPPPHPFVSFSSISVFFLIVKSGLGLGLFLVFFFAISPPTPLTCWLHSQRGGWTVQPGPSVLLTAPPTSRRLTQTANSNEHIPFLLLLSVLFVHHRFFSKSTRPPREWKIRDSNPACTGIFPGRVIPVTLKLALQWLPCQAPGVIG